MLFSMGKIGFENLKINLTNIVPTLPDYRKRNNTSHTMYDALMGAFSVFYMQSPSFLDWQTTMEETRGNNNARTMFNIERIISPGHIRNILDHVSPHFIYPVFQKIFGLLQQQGIFDSYRSSFGTLPIAIDGLWFHQSNTINCPHCQTVTSHTGEVRYSHSAVTPVVVHPDQSRVFNLQPEFISPQDGHLKQDCENAAAKRWLTGPGLAYAALAVTILADDLYCNQPLITLMTNNHYNFILSCKDNSHKYLTQWIAGLDPVLDLHEICKKVRCGKKKETHRYRYANAVPLNGGADAITVNYVELCILDEAGNIKNRFVYATNHLIDQSNVEHCVELGRSRWKIENEHNNTMKNNGYNLEHNFGHGEQHLSNLLCTLNLLAHLFHTVLDCHDDRYRLLRASLPSRKTFFDDVRALTRYFCFPDWESLMLFMLKSLELIDPGDVSEKTI